MKIAIIAEVYLPKIDGVVGRTVNLIRELQALGDDVLVICPQVSSPRNSPARVLEFQGFPCVSYPEYTIGIPDAKLIEHLKAWQPDVIHFLNPFAFGFQCFDLIQRAGLAIPTVFSFHTLYGEFVKQYRGLGLLSKLLWWLTQSYHNCADLNLTVSSPMQTELERRGFHNVQLWPPAVDGELYSKDRESLDMRKRLSANHPEKPLLLTVSRLASEKNVSFLTQILDRVPEARLAIVGGGPQTDVLKRQFARYPAEFIGYLKGHDLAAAYASADVFVYASETETMGNVILEAMSCGLPVVAANSGGVSGLVEHGHDGFLYRPRCAREASQYVLDLLTSPQRHQEISKAAIQSVSKRSWSESALEVRRTYGIAIQSFMDAGGKLKMHSPAANLLTLSLVKLFQLAAGRQHLQSPVLSPTQSSTV